MFYVYWFSALLYTIPLEGFG